MEENRKLTRKWTVPDAVYLGILSSTA